jgi:hypothetical protein
MMDLDRIMTRLNPWVVRLLESRAHGLLSRGLMVVHVEGVRSSKCYRIPVGYQRYEDSLIVLVSKSRRKNWWRNYRLEIPLKLTVRGEVKTGLASLVDKESEMFRRCVSTTFNRVPGLSRQFGIARIGAAGLSKEDWAVVKLEAQLVVIKL